MQLSARCESSRDEAGEKIAWARKTKWENPVVLNYLAGASGGWVMTYVGDSTSVAGFVA
jgi:hypothetical protein